MNILVFGKNGQVGWELARSLQPLGDVTVLDEIDADFTRPESLREIIRNNAPEVIVNAVAYTAVDAAEDNEDVAQLINATSVEVLAEEVLAHDALLIHYSTDYVFDGKASSPYTEGDSPSPLNVYGRTKLAGEQAVQRSGCKYLIFRTSWVYASRGKNFMLTMLRLAHERQSLNIVGDQVGAPTTARFLADATATCLVQACGRIAKGGFESGLYHLTTGGETSWHGFACQIIENQKQSGDDAISVESVNSIKTEDYPTPAIRPLYSCLDTTKITMDYGINIPNWSEALALCQEDL